jgi:hypothetical protein
MDMNDQDKEFEISVGFRDVTASLKLKNWNSHVGATIGETLVDQLRWFRWKNAVRTMDKYNEMKHKRNLEGKEMPLPPKYLLAILENAFMEDDDDLHDRWVTLLVNGQDPERKIEIHPSYIDILKQLSSLDANLLAEFRPKTPFMQMSVSFGGEEPNFSGEPQLFNFPERIMPIASFYLSNSPTQKVLYEKNIVISETSDNAKAISCSITNLVRLGLIDVDYQQRLGEDKYKPFFELSWYKELCSSFVGKPTGVSLSFIRGNTIAAGQYQSVDIFKGTARLTEFGYQFLSACAIENEIMQNPNHPAYKRA